MMVRNGWIYWPLELHVSPAAMREIEVAIRHHCDVNGTCGPELFTVANQIRACLQHIADEQRAPPLTDEELLS